MPNHPALSQKPLLHSNRGKSPFSGKPLLMEKPTSEGKRTMAFSFEDRHVKYAKGIIGALLSVFAILVIFSVLLVLAANKVETSVSPLGRSLQDGKLNKLVTEGHLALHSMRKLSDSIPMDTIMHHWEHTNNILQSSKVPWEELPQWRQFAQNAFRVTTQMMNKHPDWAKNIEQSTANLKSTAEPIATESKEWRKSLRGASAAYAKTLMSMYKEYLDDEPNK